MADTEAPNIQIIAEIPSPECVQSRGDDYKRARATILDAPPNALIELIGVGFFDFLHDQRGAAKNGIELHPVLTIRVLRDGEK